MPSKPDISTNDVKTAQGVLTLYTYAIGNNNGYFIATYGDYVIESSDKEATLNAVRDGMAKGGKGEMISEKKISLDEHPGREIVLKVMVENRDVRFKWRIFLVGRRLYQIGVGTAKVDAEPPDVAKFLLSFGLNK
jgi:hypothetical protein